MNNYLIEASLSLGIFYLLYFMFLKNDTFFNRNRFYLLGTSVLALVIPLIEFKNYSPPVEIPAIFLAPIEVEEHSSVYSMDISYVWLFYWFITIIMFLRFTKGLSSLIRYINQNHSISKGSYKLINTNGKKPTASFLYYLFWDNSKNLNPIDSNRILQHELTHIREKHSYDLIYMELLQIIFWFNPFVYAYKKSIHQQHEFIADEGVVKNNNAQSYTKLIVQTLFSELNLSFTHSFNKSSLIKKRIAMIQRTKTPNFLKFKALLIIPVALIMLMVYSCDDSMNELEKTDELKFNSAKNKLESENLAFGPDADKNIHVEFKGKDGKVHEMYFNPDEPNDFQFGEGEASVHEITHEIGGENDFVFSSDDENKIYDVVEKVATPVGGLSNLGKYIVESLEYPSQAKAGGVSGKVYVQFVINKDGSVSDAQVIKGIGHGCDKAALDVILNMPNWSPASHKGKIVSQKLVIPIDFSLRNKK